MGARRIFVPGIISILVAQGALMERGAPSAAGQTGGSRSGTNSGTTERSVWDGVYTVQQAERGKITFDRACASCHGDDLRGGGNPELTLAGPVFVSRWNGRPLSDLYLKVGREQGDQTKTMMRPVEINETLAYVLEANKFPAGQTGLSQLFSDLERITLSATPPQKAAR